MDRTDSQTERPVGLLADDHELSVRARAYGERVIRDDEWPLDGVDLSMVTWATSTRAKRRHGRCSYDGDGQVTITLTEHTYERAGFEACKKTVRHELVHAWQYHHRGERAVATDSGVELLAAASTDASDASDASIASSNTAVDRRAGDADTAVDVASSTTVVTDGVTATAEFEVDTGHGDSFRAWVEPLDLPGRCSRYYDRRREDFAYVYECPDCGNWWGKHRLCKSVRQAAHGGQGLSGYRYCVDCEVLLHLRAGDDFLAHGSHDDETIKAFVDGELGSTADAADADLPLLGVEATSGTDRPV